MGAVREDRRVRRTRRMLRDALLALIEEKGYDQVTVQDILDRADLSRATFYSHFRDKDDLLVSGFAELRETLREAMVAFARGESEHAGQVLAPSHALFEHVAEHRGLYRMLVGSRAGTLVLRHVRAELNGLVREHFEDVIARRSVVPTVPVEVIVEHTVGALLGVVTWWLDSATPYSIEQIAEMLTCLMPPAIEVGLGLRPEANDDRSDRRRVVDGTTASASPRIGG